MMKIKKLALPFLAVCLAVVCAFTVGCTQDDGGEITPPAADVSIVAVDPIMPVAFLSGIEYDIPQAVFVGDDGEELSYSVYFIDEAGNESLLSGDTFTPTVYVHGKNIGLKYVSEDNTVQEFSVPVLKATSVESGKTFYAFDKMFVLNNVESSALTESGTVFYGARDFSATYANALEASFAIHVKSIAGYDNFGSVIITVSDAADPSVSVNFSVVSIDDETSSISINGGDAVVMSGSVKDFENGFKLSFNSNTAKIFDVINTDVGTITTIADGRAFYGFKSGLVNVSIGVSAPRATAAISVVNINNQAMTTAASRDRIAPFVVCGEDIVILNNLKDKITVPKALAFDVLDPCAKTTVSVFTPAGDIAKTVDGKEFFEIDAKTAHEFTAEMLGEYTIQYTAIDRNGNKYGNGWYSVFIVDSVAPTLSVKNPVGRF